MGVIDPLVTCPNSHPEIPACPSTFEVFRTKEHTLTLYPSVFFTFWLIVESINEFGGVLVDAFINI
jgi:hypothetical protein